jgi:hypothetical protein
LSSNVFALSGTVIEVIDGDTIKILDRTNLAHTISLADKNAPITNQIANENSKKELASLILGKNVSVKENGKDEKGQILGQVLFDGIDINKATRPITDPPKSAPIPPVLPTNKQQKQSVIATMTPLATPKPSTPTPPAVVAPKPIQQVEPKTELKSTPVEEDTKKSSIKRKHYTSNSKERIQEEKEKKHAKEKSEAKIHEFAEKERIKTHEKLKLMREKEALRDAREAKKEAKKERKEAEKEAKKERKKAEREAKKAEKEAKKERKKAEREAKKAEKKAKKNKKDD